MNGRHRWFRDGEWPLWSCEICPEFHRLEWAAAEAGVPISLLAIAAHILADRAGVDLREAWDRLAFNLVRMSHGQAFRPVLHTPIAFDVVNLPCGVFDEPHSAAIHSR